MTRAIDILMKFARDCSSAESVPEQVREAAVAVMNTARAMRSENAIVYIGIDGGGFQKYFGSKAAADSWVKQEPGRHYKTEELLF